MKITSIRCTMFWERYFKTFYAHQSNVTDSFLLFPKFYASVVGSSFVNVQNASLKLPESNNTDVQQRARIRMFLQFLDIHSFSDASCTNTDLTSYDLREVTRIKALENSIAYSVSMYERQELLGGRSCLPLCDTTPFQSVLLLFEYK